MEVHKHPHHVTHKKKWTEYLLEFFMLFLAVFLGFVAENIRENSVEHRREKEYIESLVQDLETDTAKLSAIITVNEQQAMGLDSMANYLFNPPYSDSVLHHIYYLQRLWGINDYAMDFTRRTINQLQNAGGMHLIRNWVATERIIAYYEGADVADRQLKTFDEDFQIPSVKTSYAIFDYSFYKGITRVIAGTLLTDTKKFTLLTTDYVFLKNFANQIYECCMVQKNYLRMIKIMQQEAVKLISVLQKEYHL